MRRLSLNRSEPAKKSGRNIPKNRCRTTIPERIVETLAELPFIGDQVGCLSHDQAAPQQTCRNRSGLLNRIRKGPCTRAETLKGIVDDRQIRIEFLQLLDHARFYRFLIRQWLICPKSLVSVEEPDRVKERSSKIVGVWSQISLIRVADFPLRSN